MKKSSFSAIILFIILVIVIASLIFNFIYFRNFHRNIRPINDQEKQIILDIINHSINSTEYQIKFGNVYTTKNRELVQIQLTNNSSKRYYLVDLGGKNIIKR